MATTLTRTPHKTLPIIFLLLVFLVTLLLFSKRSIDPHLPIYTSTDPYNPLPDPQIPHPDSISTEKTPILEPKSTDLELLNNDSILKNETGFVESESVDQNPFVESNSDESESVKDDDLIVEKSSVLDDEWVKKSVDWGRGCNMYSGKWVRDDGYPIYKPGSCPFVDEAFDCQANGRADEDYMKWRWQPDQCELPRLGF